MNKFKSCVHALEKKAVNLKKMPVAEYDSLCQELSNIQKLAYASQDAANIERYRKISDKIYEVYEDKHPELRLDLSLINFV